MNEDPKPDFSWVSPKSMGMPDPILVNQSLSRAKTYLKSMIDHRKLVIFGDSRLESSNNCSELILNHFKFNHIYICFDKFKDSQRIQKNYASTSKNITNVAKKPVAPMDVSYMETLLVKSTDGKRELPKIFVCGKFLGGVDEMRENLHNGKLEKLLDDCRKNEDFDY